MHLASTTAMRRKTRDGCSSAEELRACISFVVEQRACRSSSSSIGPAVWCFDKQTLRDGTLSVHERGP
jgi:hypothetical protein